jgi:hypothetical protein
MPTPLFQYTWQYNNQPIGILANDISLLLPECNDSEKYTTNVMDGSIWLIAPTLKKTCTKVEDINTINPGNLTPQNLNGWKIGGSVVLQNQSSYSVSVGTLTVENSFGLVNDGLFPWKTSGLASAQEPPSYNRTVEPLGLFNTATDQGVPSLINYVQVKFTYDYVTYPPTGTTLEYNIMLNVERCSISETPASPTDEIEIFISFELEFLIDQQCTVSYSGV